MPGCGSWPCLLSGCLLSPADLSQVEITRAYLAKQADEISLQQADVVLVLAEEDGECQHLAGLGMAQASSRWWESFTGPSDLAL